MGVIHSKLIEIQNELKVPKSQFNKFGNYAYRNCEDIMEALKPLLLKHLVAIFITDSIQNIGERYYVKATVTLQDIETSECIQIDALARE
jgi:hypothetical protein